MLQTSLIFVCVWLLSNAVQCRDEGSKKKTPRLETHVSIWKRGVREVSCRHRWCVGAQVE